MNDLTEADRNGNSNTTWKILHEISGKQKCQPTKVKLLGGSNPQRDEESLADWARYMYFKELLNNNSSTGITPPRPATADLPIRTDPPTLKETIKAI